MEARRLRSNPEVRLARRLLHQVYVEELGWSPPAGNASGMRVEEVPGQGRAITDRFDTVATWFGVLRAETLVGCARVCGRLEGRFELEGYRELPLPLKGSDALEATRLALHHEVRSDFRVLHVLAKRVLEFCHEAGVTYLFTAVPIPQPGKIWLDLGARKLEDRPFRYAQEDGTDVHLLCMDRAAMLRGARLCEQHLERLAPRQSHQQHTR